MRTRRKENGGGDRTTGALPAGDYTISGGSAAGSSGRVSS